MNYYVIGIGGTGAKCIEALTHLCAAGMMPGAEKMPDGTLSPPVKLYALFVDPDKANGNLERARTTLDHYVDCKQLKLGNTNFLKTEIVRPKPDVWSPFDDGSPSRLDHFFKYYDLETTHPAAAHLFDVLYSPAEKNTQLDQGFRGHPSIGAAVMAKTIQLGQDEPWKTFREQLGNDTKVSGGAKIFLFGSVFGGTGASGLPTIARLIRDEKEIAQTNLRLGGALVLPYFSFTGSTKELKASSENFLMNTKVALKYYNPERMSGIYNAVYLFGDESPSPVDFHIGSGDQKNEPHFIELYAALAAIDFFKSQDPKGYSMLARHEANQLNWNDLPDGNEGNTIKQQMGHLARFTFAYLSVYLPMLE
ncbi:hypothetical protein HYR99_13155, partial [Candidatus Poribacteria bacterium]|nr:hypothetical protein [Candidatus Poribacteria bacterium]